jgi:hypothetical protein
VFGSSAVRFIAYLGLCAAHLQGGLVKFTELPGTKRLMTVDCLFDHLGLVGGSPLVAWPDLREKRA